MNNIERKFYIDGLKGIACFLIMLGHFCGIYKYAEDATQIKCTVIDVLTTSFYKILTAEGLWLYLFFVISGYLLAYASINTFLDVLKKTFLRFVRLSIPILGAGTIIYLIQTFLGFYNVNLQQYITNQWLAGYYANTISIYDVILAPFTVLIKGKATINAPYWVLRDMFLSSILIYMNLYVNKKLKPHFQYISELIPIMLLLVLLFLRRPIFFACILGMVVNCEEQWIKNKYKKCRLLLVLSFFSPIVGYWLSNPTCYSICFAMMLIAISEIKNIKMICETKILIWLGKVSFGIYSFHWPIICSLGAWILLQFIGCISNNALAIISFGTCFGATLLTSIIFHLSVENMTDTICNRLKMIFYPSN